MYLSQRNRAISNLINQTIPHRVMVDSWNIDGLASKMILLNCYWRWVSRTPCRWGRRVLHRNPDFWGVTGSQDNARQSGKAHGKKQMCFWKSVACKWRPPLIGGLILNTIVHFMSRIQVPVYRPYLSNPEIEIRTPLVVPLPIFTIKYSSMHWK